MSEEDREACYRQRKVQEEHKLKKKKAFQRTEIDSSQLHQKETVRNREFNTEEGLGRLVFPKWSYMNYR